MCDPTSRVSPPQPGVMRVMRVMRDQGSVSCVAETLALPSGDSLETPLAAAESTELAHGRICRPGRSGIHLAGKLNERRLIVICS